jgi:alpha-tubulin suppressor-like RCC1 family protein
MSHQPKVSNNNGFNFPKIKRIKESPSEEAFSTYFERVYGEETVENFHVFTWGSNEMGQLGQEIENTTTKDKDGYSYSALPIYLNNLKHLRISWVSAGDGHTISVSKNGSVYSWGASACGQLGLERIETMPRDSEGYPYQPNPAQIKLLSNVKVKEISCGDAHSIALTTEGKLYSWGGAGCGQLVFVN